MEVEYSGLINISFSPNSRYVNIGNFSFSKATKLSEVHFPDGLQVIGKSAFAETNLSNITLPETVTTLEEGCFQDNNNLKTF